MATASVRPSIATASAIGSVLRNIVTWSIVAVAIVCFGILMLTHSHVLENIQEALLIEMSHIPIGLFAIMGGSAGGHLALMAGLAQPAAEVGVITQPAVGAHDRRNVRHLAVEKAAHRVGKIVGRVAMGDTVAELGAHQRGTGGRGGGDQHRQAGAHRRLVAGGPADAPRKDRASVNTNFLRQGRDSRF